MKKFLILPILIAPIMAMADGPVGPAAASGTPVVATANAPYATASEQTGDSTTVVSASYVKGAYNDAIAAVNKVYVDKQTKLVNTEKNDEIVSEVLGEESFVDVVDGAMYNGNYTSSMDKRLLTANAAAAGIVYALDSKVVNAVTTWGNDTPTKLQLSSVYE